MKFILDIQRRHLLYLSIPALIAILISGVIDVQIVANHPFREVIGNWIPNPKAADIIRRVLWNVLQLIPAYLFGTLSDTHLRRDYLIYVQVFGVLFGIAFLIIGFKSWIVFLFALTFNPLSVARAALLDNYKKVTAVEILSITYIFKFLPWVFVTPLTSVSIQTVFYFLIPILALNVFLSVMFFRDRFDTKKKMDQFEEFHKEEKQSFIQTNKWAIIMNMVAFAFAETTFYFFWNYAEEKPGMQAWLFLPTFVTICGLVFALLYRKVPRLLTVAKIYGGLVLTTLLAFVCGVVSMGPWLRFIVIVTSVNSILGGLYLPIATTALIRLSGTKRRATGSAFAETSEVFALIVSAIVMSIHWPTATQLFIMVLILFILATILQLLSRRFVAVESVEH